MHGVNIAIRSAGRFACVLHETRFLQVSLQRPPARRRLTSDWNRILVTAFRSPGPAAPLSASIPGSTFPACNFRSATFASTARSVLRSATAIGLPRYRPLRRAFPVAASSPAATDLPENLHSPSGLLHPSGSKLGFHSTGKPVARIRPISSRSPQPVCVNTQGCGSSFQVRYVSGDLLFLKPLGTFFTMRPIPGSGKIFLRILRAFPQETSLLFSLF
jgi:hypothetical protein